MDMQAIERAELLSRLRKAEAILEDNPNDPARIDRVAKLRAALRALDERDELVAEAKRRREAREVAEAKAGLLARLKEVRAEVLNTGAEQGRILRELLAHLRAVQALASDFARVSHERANKAGAVLDQCGVRDIGAASDAAKMSWAAQHLASALYDTGLQWHLKAYMSIKTVGWPRPLDDELPRWESKLRVILDRAIEKAAGELGCDADAPPEPAAPVPPAPEAAAPEAAAPEAAAPERAAPERAAPERAAPERAAPERAAPEAAAA